MPPKRKSKGKSPKRASNVQTRKRSRSDVADDAVATQSSPGDPEPKQRKHRYDQAVKGAVVRRKIIFNDKNGRPGAASNNNATPAKECTEVTANMESRAHSDPNVIDKNYPDAVGIAVTLQASDDSDFGTEPEESDHEISDINAKSDHDNVTEDPDEDDSNYNKFLQQTGLQQVFNKLMDKKLQLAKEKWIEEVGTTNKGKGTPGKAVEKDKPGPEEERNPRNPVFKSPSDTTLYAPALNRGVISYAQTQTTPPRLPVLPVNGQNNMVDKISHFVESIRVSERDQQEAGPSREDHTALPRDGRDNHDYEEARKRAENAILEAEKYKALIAEPPGELVSTNIVANSPIGTGLSDDDFFHLTCQVDQSLITKIEKGEFIELDKLLPKDRRRRTDDNRMEWIHSEGGIFLAPVSDRMNKITGYPRWEQAFRIYATIYCGANPNRAREVWQYISVISSAASTFIWGECL